MASSVIVSKRGAHSVTISSTYAAQSGEQYIAPFIVGVTISPSAPSRTLRDRRRPSRQLGVWSVLRPGPRWSNTDERPSFKRGDGCCRAGD
eukprot:COSAG06_NODE_32793_length_500_cov_0.957606_1_plen_90_part_10